MAGSTLPYASELIHLHSDTSHGWSQRTKGRAPHKPFLLLSILDGIEAGWITGPHIELSRDLVDTFFTYWNAVMGKSHITTIALPYYHMQSEPFWELVYKAGEKPFPYSPSTGTIRERVAHAELDHDLYHHFSNPEKAEHYRQLLLSTYFDEATAAAIRELISLNRQAFDYSEELLGQVVKPFKKFAASGVDRYRDGKYQYRDKGFGRAIRRIYKDTCVLCRSRVVTQNDNSLVEGAHIIPWGDMGTDDPRNGLALCGTHHWLFDHYMLTVDDNYKIVLSNWLKEKENKIEEMIKREGSEILLPDDKHCYPALEAIWEHREKFGEVNR